MKTAANIRAYSVMAMDAVGLKSYVRFVTDLFLVGYGFIVYLLTSRTPYPSFQAFTRVFCATGGASNDFLSFWIGKFSPKYPIFPKPGIFGDGTPNQVARIKTEIEQKGYFLFPYKLNSEVCDRLTDFARVTPCIVNTEVEGKLQSSREIYDPKNPKAVRYYIPDQALIDNLDVQEIIADPTLLAIAQEYLGAKPILDHVCMWWSTAINDAPSVEDAQLYHFDLDRVRWIKFFFYLTDVTEKSGPHCYIAETHRAGTVPKQLFRRGYVRISDEELESIYPKKNFIEFTGSRGTMLAEDTRGFHKGKILESGDRLLFQLQFTNSLFCGTFGENRGRLKNVHSINLKNSMKNFPKVYSYYS